MTLTTVSSKRCGICGRGLDNSYINGRPEWTYVCFSCSPGLADCYDSLEAYYGRSMVPPISGAPTLAVANQHGATKNDIGKPRMELLDAYWLEQTAKVMGFGADKYDAWNWTKGIAYGRLIGAALRHIFAFARGEDMDPESGLLHLAHASCCLMFLLSMTKRHPELDDRDGKAS